MEPATQFRQFAEECNRLAQEVQTRPALMDKLQIIERYNHRTKRCCVLSQDDGTSSSDRRAIECPKAGNVRKTRQRAHRSPSDCWYCSGVDPAGTAASGLLLRRSTRCDHFVGGHLQVQRHRETQRSGGLEVNDELNFHHLLNRKISRSGAF